MKLCWEKRKLLFRSRPPCLSGWRKGRQRMRDLHDRLNTAALNAVEEWPYMPHLTIAKLSSEALAETGVS